MANSSSNAVFKLGYPRRCYGCGLPVKADDGWFETIVRPYEQRSWHHGCRPAGPASEGEDG